MLIVVEDIVLNLVLQIVYGKKVPPLEDVLSENAEPDFNGVEPGAVFGRIDEADTMLGITQVRLPARHVLKNAGFAFLT